MNIWIEPGSYVLAVSGGLDSMVLLDLLARQPGLKLTVAHYDHGIREDSAKDRLLVQETARRHGLPFVYDQGNLGATASEAAARDARYAFLYKVQKMVDANAVITAHHQDDLLETAVINILRGTGRRGLSSLKSGHVLRPLLHLDKQTLIGYAKQRNIGWREDSTNADTKYLRNYVRQKLLPRFSESEKAQFLSHIEKTAELNREIDEALINHLHMHPSHDALDRHWFIMLPHAVALELLASWLREHGVRDFNKKLLQEILVSAKTLHPGKQIDVNKDYIITVTADTLALIHRDR
jgi:tRNA(Ile)-lysidine synthetase-like protein